MTALLRPSVSDPADHASAISMVDDADGLATIQQPDCAAVIWNREP